MSLPTLYQDFIHLSRYSRWLPEENRRETWEETVRRYFDFFDEHLRDKHGYQVSKRERKDCLLYTSPSPRDRQKSRMPSSA